MSRNLLKEHSTLLEATLQFADPVFVVAVGVVAYHAKFDSWDLEARYVTALLAVLVVAFVVFSTLKLHQSQRGISFAEELRGLLVAWLAIAVIGIVFLFLTKTGSEFSREWALVWITSGFLAHAASRAAIRVVLRALAPARPQPAPRRHRRRRPARPRDRRTAQVCAVERPQRARLLRRLVRRGHGRRHSDSGRRRPRRAGPRARGSGGPGMDRAAAARRRPHPRGAERTAPDDRGRALRSRTSRASTCCIIR